MHTKGSVRVLLVEDSKFLGSLIGGMLEQHPVLEVVGVAENGLQALQLAESLCPAVIITDLEMPVMDGLLFITRQMRERPVPIIIFSALDADNALVVQALLSGAIDYLQKPLTHHEVIRRQQELVNRVLRYAARR